jgi:hypothetical protein
MTGPARYTHLVGALTAPSASAAMTTALRYLGSTLLSLPDGENPTEQFPTRHLWIQPELLSIPGLPGAVNCNPDAKMTGYDDVYWWRAEQPLTADDFAQVVILLRAFEQTYPAFRKVSDQYQLPGLRFQIGTPAPLDLGVMSFRDAGLAPALQDPITAAKAAQVRAVHAQAADVVFQMESPWSVNMVATSDDLAKTAEYAAGLLVDLPQRCPGTMWGVHLCDGDWFHEANTEPGSALPLVLLANEIAAQWPTGPDAPVLDYIHLPLAAAAKPPAMDAAWYEALGDLRLPEGCRFAAGFVHEALDLSANRAVLGLVEDAYGAQVTIATSCGLGRRPDPDQVPDALEKMAALAAT